MTEHACYQQLSLKVHREEIEAWRWRKKKKDKELQSYFGSCVKAWKPAFEATNRRIAWKWLSSSALRAGNSASWDRRARMALLMSFSLFSEKRPWGESSARVGVNKWSAPADTWTPVGRLARHTHVLRYCMQNSTVGYVGVESEHRICKVAIWEENVRGREDHKSFQILQMHSRLGDAKLWLTGRRCQEFEMQALHLLVHGHAQKAPSLSPLRRRHFHTHVPVAWRADTVQETGKERVPVQTHGHSTTHLNV